MARSLETLMQWEEQYTLLLCINYSLLSKGFKRFHVLQSTRKVSIISSLMDDAGWCHYEGMLHVPPTLWVRIIAFSSRQRGIQCGDYAALCRSHDLKLLHLSRHYNPAKCIYVLKFWLIPINVDTRKAEVQATLTRLTLRWLKINVGVLP